MIKLIREVAKNQVGVLMPSTFVRTWLPDPIIAGNLSVKMALQAKNDFPEIDLTKSIMAGDTLSDLQFGKNAGMKTIYINTNDATMPEI